MFIQFRVNSHRVKKKKFSRFSYRFQCLRMNMKWLMKLCLFLVILEVAVLDVNKRNQIAAQKHDDKQRLKKVPNLKISTQSHCSKAKQFYDCLKGQTKLLVARLIQTKNGTTAVARGRYYMWAPVVRRNFLVKTDSSQKHRSQTIQELPMQKAPIRNVPKQDKPTQRSSIQNTPVTKPSIAKHPTQDDIGNRIHNFFSNKTKHISNAATNIYHGSKLWAFNVSDDDQIQVKCKLNHRLHKRLTHQTKPKLIQLENVPILSRECDRFVVWQAFRRKRIFFASTPTDANHI